MKLGTYGPPFMGPRRLDRKQTSLWNSQFPFSSLFDMVYTGMLQTKCPMSKLVRGNDHPFSVVMHRALWRALAWPNSCKWCLQRGSSRVCGGIGSCQRDLFLELLYLAVQCAPKDLFAWFVQPRNSTGFCSPTRAKFEEDTVYLWAMGLKNLFPGHPMPKETRLRLRSKTSATHEDIAIWLDSSVFFWIQILNESITVLFWKWLTLILWLKAILSVTLFWMFDPMSRLVPTR